MIRGSRARRPDAESLAAGALALLAVDAERLERFFALTGLTPQTLRQAATGPDFASALLDYIVTEDELVLALAARLKVAPQEIAAMQAALAHGAEI